MCRKRPVSSSRIDCACEARRTFSSVGVVLYVTAKVAGISFERVTRATLPFLVPLLVVLAAITVWPPLTTRLPKLVMAPYGRAL